jgi:hypothetical protein
MKRRKSRAERYTIYIEHERSLMIGSCGKTYFVSARSKYLN